MTPSQLLMANTSPEKLGRTSHFIHLLGIGENFQNSGFDRHRGYHSNVVMTSPIYISPIYSKSRPKLLKWSYVPGRLHVGLKDCKISKNSMRAFLNK